MNLHFLITGDINTPSGEFVYIKKIIEGLRNKKYKVFTHNLPGDFPFPNDNSVARCEIILKAIPPDDVLLLPGAAISANHALIEKYAGSHKIIALIHSPISNSRELTLYQKEITLESEKKALEKIKYCIVSNEVAKKALIERGAENSRIYVALPGIDNFPIKKDYKNVPSQLLCLSNYTRKNGLINLTKALSALKNINWEMACYGIKDFDPHYMDELNMLIRKNELDKRITLNNALPHDTISNVYLNADLVILPSDYESFGMTISEALMHGIPIVASSSGLINQSIPQKAGKFFKPGNIYDIQSVLELIFENPGIYSELCKNAAHYHYQSRSWDMAVSDFENAIQKINLLLRN